jgi:methionyl-tRNA formyltransferase
MKRGAAAMRVVFMGTPDFAVPTLRMLLAEDEVVAVYTRPDRPSGRGRRVVPSPVKAAAEAAGVPVRQPQDLTSAEETARLSADRLDVIVVAAFGVVLPRAVLDIPVHGCINVHASLLPRWRGAAPVQRAILAGDGVTGITIMRMEAGLDTGPFSAQKQVDVGEKDAAELTAALAACGATLLSGVMPGLAAGTLAWQAQDDALATYAPKLTSADVALDPGLTVHEVLLRVRASGASAPCRVRVGGRNLTVLRAVAGEGGLEPGSARCGDGLELGCADGTVRLAWLVPEGRAAMSGDSFARGARLGSGCGWGPA